MKTGKRFFFNLIKTILLIAFLLFSEENASKLTEKPPCEDAKDMKQDHG